MFCPTCEAEYRDGFIRCTDCNVALVPAPPVRKVPSRAAEAPASEVELFRSLDHLDTELVAGALAEAGISCTIRTRMAGGLQLAGIDSHWAPGQWRVLYVPGAAEDEAQDVLASIRGGPPVLHAVESEPFDAGFVARRKRAIGIVVLLPFLVGLSFALLAVIRELSR